MNSSGKQQKGLTVPERSYGYHAAPQTDGQPPEEEEGCGLFCLQPRWMRPLGNRVTYLLVYCACGLVQGMWYTYFVSILTTVEKTFKFPSSVTGIILAGNDVAQIFFAVLISYYGGRGNRPRWVGGGMLLNALGCLLSALPQFVWGPDPADVAAAMTGTSFNASGAATASNSLCSLSGGDLTSAAPVTDCDAQGDVSLVPVILLFVSQFVSGVGATAYYTLGLTYLDDSVDKKQSPVMFAVTAGLRVMGPMLGFMLGSFSLSKFVIPSLKPTIAQKDPRWIGAWWLGFFVLAGLLTVVSSLMCLFPKKLRQQAVQAETEGSVPADGILMDKMDKMMGSMDELHTGARPAEQLKDMDSLKSALMRLFHNPLLMVLLLNVVFVIIGFIGYFTYMPKYQMAAFSQSASKASLFSGLSGVLVTLVGYIGSGVVIKYLQPRAVFVTGYGALVSGAQTVCMFALMAVRCDQVPLHGTSTDDGQFMLTADCNAGCDCAQSKMNPVCSEDGRASFFSPCFAGCQTMSNVNGSVLYGNCSCIVEVESGKAGGGIFSHLATATSGLCELPCDSFVTYMIILAFMKFVGSTNRTGGMLVFFRSVADKDKSLAIGMATALMSVFAFIPAPILFGAVVDQTCLIWEEKPCGGRGNCLHYDIDKLRVHLHTAVIIPFAISFVLDMAVIYLARNVKLYGDDEPKKDGKKSSSNGAALDVPM